MHRPEEPQPERDRKPSADTEATEHPPIREEDPPEASKSTVIPPVQRPEDEPPPPWTPPPGLEPTLEESWERDREEDPPDASRSNVQGVIQREEKGVDLAPLAGAFGFGSERGNVQ
jgi:hypothetical protein